MQKRIILKDHLKHDKYHWPITMLSYPLVLEEETAEENWVLRNEQGAEIPFQITDVQREGERIKQATLHFLADLKQGDCKEYILETKEAGTGTPKAELIDTAFCVEIEKEKGQFTVIYKEQKMVCKLPFESLEYRVVYSGSIFEEIEIVCKGKQEQEYLLNVRRIAKMPFWELKECMNHFDENEKAEMRISFEGFDFTHRHSWDRPVEKIDSYLKQGNTLPVVVTPFENWFPWFQSKYMAFLGSKHSAGLFIRDNLGWDDEKYPIWGANRDFGITFSYDNDSVSAHFPMKNGKRFVGIAAYEGNEARYVETLWRWYAYFHLDKVKNWVLDWEEDQKQYPKFFDKKMAHPFVSDGVTHYKQGDMLTNSKMTEIIDTASSSVNGDISPVLNREFADWTVVFDLTADEMTKEAFDRAKAWFAFMGYACMDENYMPIENMLAGHPNFLGDSASVPGFVAALFQNHPEKEKFRKYFHHAVSLNMKYHIRPDVEAYESLGGRETENLSCYSFAMLRPMMEVCELYRLCGYPIPLVCENGAKWLNWMTNCMSAPVDGKRQIPTQGAHARSTEIPHSLYVFAQLMEKDYPEVAQNTYAVCLRTAEKDFECNGQNLIWRLLPHKEKKGSLSLKSEKFTGYGCILREAVGTDEEISVHVQQLDLGPNYRWGTFENTGNGGIHYYAAGKRYSYSSREAVGDENVGAEQGNCGFAVLKGHTYHNIGFHDLTEPLRDLPLIKQIKLLADDNVKDFYKYRRVSLVEKDYAVMYDAVTHMRARGRFLWTVNELEEYPEIFQLLPGAEFTVCETIPVGIPLVREDIINLPPERNSKTIAYDGHGNFLTVVSHRKDIRAEVTAYGGVVSLPDRTDHIFEDEARICYDNDNLKFSGYSGIISVHKNGTIKGALTEGKEIGCKDLQIVLQGKSAVYFSNESGVWEGCAVADEACTLWINGKSAALQKGKYHWRLQEKICVEKLPERSYSGINGFVRDTRRHETGFSGYDFDVKGEILTYPQRV